MKFLRRRWWKYVLLSLVFMMLGFTYSYHVPQIKSWLLFQISDASRKQGPFYVFADAIDLSIFPLGLKIQQIRLIPKPEIRKHVDKIFIHEVRAGVDPLTFFGGRFGLSEVIVSKPTIHARIVDRGEGGPKGSESSDATFREIPIKNILNYPIHRLEIEGLTGDVVDMETKTKLTVENLDIAAENWAGNLVLTVAASPMEISSPTSNTGDMVLAGRIQLNTQQLQVQNLKLQKDTSFLSLSGFVQGQIAKLQWNQLKFESSGHFDIEPLAKLVSNFKKEPLPRLVGQWDQKIAVEGSNEKIRSIAGYLKTEGLGVADVNVGMVEGAWTFKDDAFLSTLLTIENSAGKVEFKNLRAETKAPYKLGGLISVQKLELRQLLQNLGAVTAPIHYDLSGELPCEGQVEPIQLSCTGQIRGRNFRAWSTETKKDIVGFKDSLIVGGVSVTPEGVFPKATLQIGETKGEASGRVLFKEGFHIDYKTPQFNFSDLTTLAGLKFEGRTSIVGSTSGDGEHAIIDMKNETKDFWFEDHGVGNARLDLAYRAGVLSFQNIEGVFRTSRYVGSVAVDLDRSSIQAKAKLPYLELNDLQRLFSKKVKLPFTSLGSGTGEVTVSGPLEFTKLTYNVRSTIQNGSINDERFNEIHFDVSAKQGHVTADRVSLRKNKGLAILKGTGSPDGTIDTVIEAKSFNLQDFQTLSQIGTSMSGVLNFGMTMKGPVLRPDTRLRGSISETFIGTDSLQDSGFEIAFSRNSLITRGNFIGGTLQLNLELPLTDDAPFRWDMTAKNWNFAPVFALISSDVNTREYDTSLTGEIKLASPRGGFWNATGTIDIDAFRLKHGTLEMQSNEKLTATFDDGQMNIQPWTVRGDNTLLTLEASRSSKSKLNISLNGKVELNLLSFLTPFFSDLRGSLSLASQLTGSTDDPRLVGSAFIEKGFAKLRALPHAFEDIRMDVLFSRRQLLINSLESRFAEGRIIGDGTIQFVELRNLPTDLRGRFENVNLQIPNGVQTQGSGDFHITGKWFPFLFTSNYEIQSGTVTRAFDEEEISGPTLKRANLLPEFLTQQDFEPLQYNITTTFDRGVSIRNTLMEADFTGQLTIKGTTSRPVLGGEVNARRGGKLYFRDAPFEISSANIRFSDPRENNPLIYLSGTSRIKEYDITLLAQGTSKNLQLSLRSQPQLAEQDIITLLALGVDPNELERTRDLRASPQQSSDKPKKDDTDKFGYEVGAALLSRNPLGKEIKKRTGIEVKFSSAVDQADNAAVPRIVVSKEWSPKINTSASRTFGNKVTQNVKLEYRLNNSVSVIGSWEGTTFTEDDGTQSTNQGYFGLDLQYKVEFK